MAEREKGFALLAAMAGREGEGIDTAVGREVFEVMRETIQQ